MEQGRLRLPNGFSMLCRYRFESAYGGRLDLGTALYGALPASSEARLIPADGQERLIRILLAPEPSLGEFEVISDQPCQQA
jgi:hypothetical protein